MTNDLKQIETLKISNELLIITEIFSFVLSLVAGLLNSWFRSEERRVGKECRL